MKHIFILLFFFGNMVVAQQTVTLNECYELLSKNYPLLKQGGFIEKQKDLDLEILANKRKPSIELLAQASYQSDVTTLPISIPNVSIEPPNKEQYRASINVNQLIYDGGLLKATEKAKKNSSNSQKKALEVSVYQLRLQLNQLYYSVLLLQEKDALLQEQLNALNVKIKEVKAGIKYGVLLPSQDDILEAEKLKINQFLEENKIIKSKLKKTISQLIYKDISNYNFNGDEVSLSLSKDLKRPELDLFQLKKEEITINSKVFDYKNKPKLVGFAQGGIGNPALNFLDNSLQAYYVVGLKFKWNVFDWKTSKKEKQKLLINKDYIDNQQEIFELNANIELNNQFAEINNLESQINSDKNIIELRKKVLKTVASQLKNGVITSSIYVTELTNLNQAEIRLKTHQTQLLLAKVNYNTILGQ